jgi:enamine deaminase RidA (YjgF/YER057c/UK114 family)
MSQIKRLHPSARYSEGSIHDHTVYLAGQVASDAADVKGQTAEVLSNIEQLLAEAGSSKSHILMAQIFLADMADYSRMNAVWDAWVVPECAPSRATVQAQLARPEWKIEIVITAACA